MMLGVPELPISSCCMEIRLSPRKNWLILSKRVFADWSAWAFQWAIHSSLNDFDITSVKVFQDSWLSKNIAFLHPYSTKNKWPWAGRICTHHGQLAKEQRPAKLLNWDTLYVPLWSVTLRSTIWHIDLSKTSRQYATVGWEAITSKAGYYIGGSSTLIKGSGGGEGSMGFGACFGLCYYMLLNYF